MFNPGGAEHKHWPIVGGGGGGGGYVCDQRPTSTYRSWSMLGAGGGGFYN